jgi:hypothetical protein
VGARPRNGGCLANRWGRQEKEKKSDFFIPLTINTDVEIKSRKIARSVIKIRIFSRDRLGHLEQLWLLTLCPKLNKFQMKIEI